jgi:hypothetical protein
MIAAMKWMTSVVLVLLGCGDGTGTSAECAFGGAITDCPDAARTPEAACWRLVDCGALVVEGENEFDFDWGRCVDNIARQTEDRRRIILSCIAAATCDELRVDRSFCFEFGE